MTMGNCHTACDNVNESVGSRGLSREQWVAEVDNVQSCNCTMCHCQCLTAHIYRGSILQWEVTENRGSERELYTLQLLCNGQC